MSALARSSGNINKKDKSPNNVIKIPKSVFERTLEVINNPQHPAWTDRNNSCAKAIHRSAENNIRGMRSVDICTRMFLARTCLMKRDLKNLAKVLTVTTPSGGRIDARWYPLCLKYGVLCLAHKNHPLFNLYLQSLASSDNSEETVKKCTQYSQNVETCNK
ncbi:PREDICTED: uncharacterized protein LOC108965960 [Bactrocera latifrons]|uniref:uncharacterized protein LOC108965960 n=1 Tax=Bactrocera latifrons TaxID=174628 RepID=UPI0008DD8FD3|nr:PREDICTED: uncharacterized protein LOC108965960 [Bactrocera latifrons]